MVSTPPPTIDASAKPMFENGLLQRIGEQRLLLLLEIVDTARSKENSRTMPSCRAQCPQQSSPLISAI
ncbi:MAG: hypothetical protein DI540_18750 [Sphingobium sp.]|nr:MAG: hypothetical protein DI540_18750 [Sphingobium sp.]